MVGIADVCKVKVVARPVAMTFWRPLTLEISSLSATAQATLPASKGIKELFKRAILRRVDYENDASNLSEWYC